VTSSPGTLVLTRRDVQDLLGLDECLAAAESALRLQAEGRILGPAVVGIPSREGGFHIKAAGLEDGRVYFAAKTNANFPGNPGRVGLPTIQGVIVLCDGEDGRALALMDSIEVTLRRTAAATALAARHLARADAATATVVGCGTQGWAQLRALTRVLPLSRVYAFDTDPAAAEGFARELSAELSIDVCAVRDLVEAAPATRVWATCTPSRSPILRREDVAPGAFVAALGADSEEKQELDPALMAAATIVVDVLDQCAAFGDLHHALEAGSVRREDVHAELADVVAGRRPGRTRADEITVFDSTGTALLDVAAAAAVYRKAVAAGVGLSVRLGD
jgi:alanine dehydrogenase